MKVLIIIPAYNEGENIERVVNSLKEICPQFDCIVVNDGSKDNTAEICRKNHFTMIDLPVNLGLAGGFQAGMRYADRNGYDAALQFDGDGQHDAHYIAAMVEAMEQENVDIIIGSRFVTEKKPHSLRMLGSNLISFAIWLTTAKKIFDPTSGMRLFRKNMIHIFANNINFGPEPDTISFLMKSGASVKELQVEMHDRIAGTSYLNFSRSIRYMTHMIVSILVIQIFRKKK